MSTIGNGASYDDSLTNDRDMVRFHLNDTANPAVFTDREIDGILTREGAVKLAAAAMIDANASNEALASKVLRTQDRSVDGAKLADALRKHATELRRQHFEDDDAGGFAFDVVDFPTPHGGHELESHAHWPGIF